MMTKSKVDDLKKAAKTHVEKARGIAEKAREESRDFTADEKAQFDAEMASAKGILGQIQAAKADVEILDFAKGLAADLGDPSPRAYDADGKLIERGFSTTGKGYLGLSGPGVKHFSANVATLMHEDVNGRRQVKAAGSGLVNVPLLDRDPVEIPRVPQSFLELIPSAPAPAPAWKYLRQTVRTNNAAPVAVGGTKPTSVFTWGSVDAGLHVIAHLSEAIDKYLLEDASALQRWIEGELAYGLRVALEAQVLNGSGTAPAIRGLLNVSGIQTQAFATDVLTSTRVAITKLETNGLMPKAFVVSPTDWEALELSSADADSVAFRGLPVDRTQQKLWGVPVALSTVMPADTAVLLDTSALNVATDRQGVEIKWSENYADDFAKNQLRARCEGRFELEVTQPLGVVAIETAA